MYKVSLRTLQVWYSPGSVRLLGVHREPAVASEVLLAADDAYRARAAASFPRYECVPRPNAINPPYQVLAITFLFIVARSPWENRTNLQFGSWLQA